MTKFSSSSLGRGFRKSASIADIASSYSISESESQENASSFSSSPPPSPRLPPSPFRSPPTLHVLPGPSPLATIPPIIAASSTPSITASPKPSRSKRFRFFSLSKRHLRTLDVWEAEDLSMQEAGDGSTPPPNTPQPDADATPNSNMKTNFKAHKRGFSTSSGSMKIPMAGLFRRATATGHDRSRSRKSGRAGVKSPGTPTPRIPTPSPRTGPRRRYTLHGFGRSPSDYDGMGFESKSDQFDDDGVNGSSQPVKIEQTVSHIRPSRHPRFAKVMSPVVAALNGRINDQVLPGDYYDCEGYTTTTTYDLIDPYDPILTSVQANNLALHLVENSHSSAGSSVILLLPPRFSGSGSTSTSSSGSGLPTPPIILSAPTPPPALRITTSESYIIRSGEKSAPSSSRRIDGTIFTNPFDSSSPPSGLKQTRGDLFAIAHTLQYAARQVESDPTFNQRTLFKSTAPLVAFLYTLAAGVLVPRYMYTSSASPAVDSSFNHNHNLSTPHTYSSLTLISLSTLGLGLILLLTRLIVWAISRIGQSFCGMDVNQALKTGECVDAEGGKVSQADMLVGGILGM
ncbi:hypothetical protein CPB83DRAFT_854673 [Crepidotus variabilis]|uniref:Uncharacterized protein n=1 Tax=Crepidotus variabilis TaxID=179855 RepID=A0A9P6JQ07_9AGAR|nr:hypothetical protein CPB83DRAFT_854673 [Crepidotus variabilis]